MQDQTTAKTDRPSGGNGENNPEELALSSSVGKERASSARSNPMRMKPLLAGPGRRFFHPGTSELIRQSVISFVAGVLEHRLPTFHG